MNGIGNLQQRDGYKEMVATKKFVDMLPSDPKDVRNDMFLPAKAEKEVAVYGTNKAVSYTHLDVYKRQVVTASAASHSQ